MTYTTVADSPLGQLLLLIESKLQLAYNDAASKAKRNESSSETASQVEKLLDLVKQGREILNVYNNGKAPNFTDVLLLPKLWSFRSKIQSLESAAYKNRHVSIEPLVELCMKGFVKTLQQQDLSSLEQTVAQLPAKLNSSLSGFNNGLISKVIIVDIFKELDFNPFNLDYFKNKANDFPKEFAKLFAEKYHQKLASKSPLYRYDFPINNPILLEIGLDLANTLLHLPKDKLQDIISFLSPEAIEQTAKLAKKTLVHQGNFIFKDNDTKKEYDVNALYNQYITLIPGLINTAIFNYINDFADTPKVKSEKAKAELICKTIESLNQELFTAIQALLQQSDELAQPEESMSKSETLLHQLIQRLDQLNKMTSESLEKLAKCKEDLLTKFKTTNLDTEIHANSAPTELKSLLEDFAREKLDLNFVKQPLLNMQFIKISDKDAVLMTVREYINNVFDKFKKEIEQSLNRTKTTTTQRLNQTWQAWVQQQKEKHSQTIESITRACDEIQAKASQIKFELGALPEDLDRKEEYFNLKVAELENKNKELQVLQQDLNLEEKKLIELSENVNVPEEFVSQFGNRFQKEIHNLYDTKINYLEEIKSVIKIIEINLLEHDKNLKKINEKIQFEKTVNEGNTDELKSILNDKLQILHDLHKDFNSQQLQIKQDELKTFQTPKPKENLENLQKKFNDKLLSFKEELENFYKPLTILNINVPASQRQDIVEILESLAVSDQREVIKCIKNFGLLHEENTASQGLVELYKIYKWIEDELKPAAKQNLSTQQVENLLVKTKEFNNPHVVKLFFEIICPDIKVTNANHWQEFYLSLRKIYHPSILTSEATKAQNKLKLEKLTDLADATYKTLLAKEPLEKIINTLTNIEEELSQIKVDITNLERETQLEEEISILLKKEKQLFNLNQTSIILGKLIIASEEIQVLNQEINSLKEKLNTSSEFLTQFTEINVTIEALLKSLKTIANELQDLNSLLHFNDTKDYESKCMKLSNVCLTLQSELTKLANSYQERVTEEFNLKLKNLQHFEEEFKEASQNYLISKTPTTDKLNVLLKQLSELSQEINKFKVQTKVITEKHQSAFDLSSDTYIAINEFSESNKAELLTKKMLDYIDELIQQAQDKSDQLIININNVHKKDCNKSYRQLINDAGYLINKASYEMANLKNSLSNNYLTENLNLAKIIKPLEGRIKKIQIEVDAKSGCITSAYIRIQKRKELANFFKQELDNYLINRAKRFNVKDNLTAKDSKARRLFIKGSEKTKGLEQLLDDFILKGDSRALLEFININKTSLPGYHLQPLVNRLTIAIKNYEKIIPINYSSDLTAEVYIPSLNVADAKNVLEHLQQNIETKALAVEIEKLYQAIETMYDYGVRLKDEAVIAKNIKESSAQTVINLANDLKENLDEFLVKNETTLQEGGPARKQLLQSFQQDFKTLLHSEDDHLSEHHGEAWKRIVANIALSVFTLIKLTVSKLTTNQASFFFQQTERLKKVDAVEHSLDAVVASAALI
ncbi:hypothetical protein ACNVED_09050 [Legionella sp. D16C41]|uniref:hypothetical protein n=1 Tax=Legionella sp. D16C41 TaxID=3402688 RepID=UPI003AF80F47